MITKARVVTGTVTPGHNQIEAMAALVRRATEGEAETAFALIDEYCATAGVVVRDARSALHGYLTARDAGIWIAYWDGAAVGCIVLRPLIWPEPAGEVKRLYVRPDYRGKGIAESLLEAVEGFAFDCGCHWLYLDTMADMHQAQRFYKRSGYQPCERYNDNPQASIFMRKAVMPPLLLRHFKSGDEAAFCHLNESWIEQYFKLEEKDRQILRQPDGYILSQGGQIFMAVRGGVAVGCCALIPMGNGTFELSKMGVAEAERGKGIGRRLLRYAVAEAQKIGVRRLYLETNHELKNAIHLYEAVGFIHVPADRVTPSPYERADVYMEMMLNPA